MIKKTGALLRYIWQGLSSSGINEENFPPSGSHSEGDHWSTGHGAGWMK
jgi:hypothetical protein